VLYSPAITNPRKACGRITRFS